MSDLLTHIERSELVDVDLDKEPQCEGVDHPDGTSGHNASQPARWLWVNPCCGHTRLLCDARVKYLQAATHLRCLDCGRLSQMSVFRFIEL